MVDEPSIVEVFLSRQVWITDEEQVSRESLLAQRTGHVDHPDSEPSGHRVGIWPLEGKKNEDGVLRQDAFGLRERVRYSGRLIGRRHTLSASFYTGTRLSSHGPSILDATPVSTDSRQARQEEVYIRLRTYL